MRKSLLFRLKVHSFTRFLKKYLKVVLKTDKAERLAEKYENGNFYEK